MAISIATSESGSSLFGKSHWWGMPDMPADVPFPCGGEPDEDGNEDLMTFICQINLEEVAPYGAGGLLPAKGMLYFFACIDYFLGDSDAVAGHIGFWDHSSFKVIYVPDVTELHTHEVKWPDGSPAYMPAQAIAFAPVPEGEGGHKLLGVPFFDEVRQECPAGMVSLLQVDDDERWGLQLYDMGNINFLISPEALAARDFSAVELYFHSM